MNAPEPATASTECPRPPEDESAVVHAHEPAAGGKSSFLWSLISYAIPKIGLSIKFFAAARLGGTTEMGFVAIVMLILAVAEGITDFGVQASVVQSRRVLDGRQLAVLWSLCLVRGGALWALTSAIAGAVMLAHSGRLGGVLLIGAWISLIRGAAGPSIWMQNRALGFRYLTNLALLQAAADLATFVVLMLLHRSVAESFLAAAVAGELVRCLASHLSGEKPERFSLDLGLVRPELRFGREVWLTSVLTVILNQADKALTGFSVGTANLGAYNTTGKLAQFAIGEPMLALQTYLFPRIAVAHRSADPASSRRLQALIRWPAHAVLALSASLIIARVEVVKLTLGRDWVAYADLFGIFCAAMCAASAVSVLVALARGQGSPEYVKRATFVQLAVLLLAGAPAALLKSTLFLAGAYTAALYGAVAALTFQLWHGQLVNLRMISREMLLPGFAWLSLFLAFESTGATDAVKLGLVTGGCLLHIGYVFRRGAK